MLKSLQTLAFAAGLLGLAGAVAAPVRAADIKPHLIRFGYGLSQTSNQGRAADFFAQDLAKRTDGKLKLKGFSDASLGSDMQMQDALMGGVQEMAVVSTATLVGIVKDFGVYDLPFLFTTNQMADKVLDGPFGQKLMDKLKAKGLVGLVYWENGFRNLTNSKRPVAKVEDLKGIKLRVMQNPVYIDMFDAMGANAVPLAFSELFSAMETGAVDGQENPVTTIQSSKFYEVQKYLSLTRHVYSPWIVLASKQWWDTLTPDEQKAIGESAAASRDFERKDSRQLATQSVAFLKEHGMQVNEVPDSELQRMRKLAQPAFDKFAADGEAGVLKDLEAAIQAAK